jgi:hypothetical protein
VDEFKTLLLESEEQRKLLIEEFDSLKSEFSAA